MINDLTDENSFNDLNATEEKANENRFNFV